MGFRNGMLGACIVTVALLCTVLAGFMMDVEETDRQVLDYRQITDVTGQFNSSQSPYFLDYTPSENYTGYTYDTFDFVSSSNANPYRVETERGTTTTQTVDLTTLSNSQTSSRLYMWQKMWNPNYISVKALLEGLGYNYRDYDSIRIDLYDSSTTWRPYLANTYVKLAENWVQTGPGTPKYNDGVYDRTYYLRTSEYSQDNYCKTYYGNEISHYTNVGFGNFMFSVNGTGPNAENMDETTYALWLEVLSDSTVVCYESRNGETSVKYSIDYSQAMIDWSDYLCQQPTTLALNVYGTAFRDYLYGGSIRENTYLQQWQPTHNIKLTLVENSTYAYMNVSEGVGLKEGVNSTTWMNTHTNGDINILFKLDDLNGYDFNVSCAGASVDVRTNGSTLSINDRDMGAWRNFVLSFNAQKGIIGFQPVSAFSNFQVYTAGAVTKITNTSMTSDSTDSFTVTRANGSPTPRWSVTSTTVWLNTYDVVMIDPSINLRSYFPSTEQPILRLNFNSFSVIGDSITINNVTYPVTDGEITVSTETAYETIPIRGLNITWDSTDNTIALENGKMSIDLGESVSDTVSLSGPWYFIANAFEGYYTSEKALDWDAGHWVATFEQAIVIFLALLGAGLLIGHKSGKVKSLDYIVVIFAALISLLVVV